MKASEINIHYFLLACKEGRTESVAEYISDGFDVNISDKDGVSGLLLAIIWWHDEIIWKLLDAWADPNQKDNDWRSPLGWAISFNKPQIASLLLLKWAKIENLETGEIATAKAFWIDLWGWIKKLSESERQAYKNFSDWMRNILMQDPTKGLDKSFESIDKKMDKFWTEMEEFNRNEDKVISGIVKPISFIILFVVILILVLWR